MDSFGELTIKCNEKQSEVKINTEIPPKDSKDVICKKFEAESDLQTSIHPNTKENTADETRKPRQLEVKSDSLATVAGLTKENVAGPSMVAHGAYPKRIESKIRIRPLKEFNQLQPREIKMLEQPRKGKKLVVLDIDATIFDCSFSASIRGHMAVRPYLQEFLSSVYEDYDIALWSATKMKAIERKVEILGMVNNSNYKILFYMDRDAMISVPVPGEGVTSVKPLDMVWGRFDQFNKKNTIMCDDLKKNFYLNRRNGLQVSPYYYYDHETDDELLKLMNYLKYLAKSCDNLSQVDHSCWKEYMPENKDDN